LLGVGSGAGPSTALRFAQDDDVFLVIRETKTKTKTKTKNNCKSNGERKRKFPLGMTNKEGIRDYWESPAGFCGGIIGNAQRLYQKTAR
jgi:hypothetical protein